MQYNERSRDVFEHIGDYPKPPLIPVPEMKYDHLLFYRLGLKENRLTKFLAKFIYHGTGFKSYYQHFPAIMEDVLRKNNFRLPGLFAPAISATIALNSDPGKANAIERAVSLIFGARSLYFDLFAGKLEPDRYQGQPLEMGQYPNLFSTSLIIENKKVRLFKSTQIDQITVLRRGHFYIITLEGTDEDTKMTGLKSALQQITNNGETTREKNSPGILTAATDRTQKTIFEKMRQNPVNKTSLEALRHSFLTLCLDLDIRPPNLSEAARLAHSANYKNRWFHSSLQIIVFGDASACAICNFTANLDGNTMMRAGSEIQKRAAGFRVPDSTAAKTGRTSFIRKLNWDIDPAAFDRAESDFKPLIMDQQATFVINGIGKKTFGSKNLPAIPVFIAALQHAGEKLARRPVWIQQFLTMNRFRCMDLETSDVSTPGVKRFTGILNKTNPDKLLAAQLLKDAIQSQIEVNRIARSSLSIMPVILGFTRNTRGIHKIYLMILIGIIMIFLRLFRQLDPQPRDIVVSHPVIFDNVPILGRPGIRLPYVRCFGLHYQIFDEKIVITLMPGLKWDVPNKKVVEEIENSLKRIIDLLN